MQSEQIITQQTQCPDRDHQPTKMQSYQLAEIYYLCPDIKMPSAGIRRLYRHVDLLHQSGFKAHIMHMHRGFHLSDMPLVPLSYLDGHQFSNNMIVVIPEGLPKVMDALKNFEARRFVIALNWDYVFKAMPSGLNWRSYNIERVMVLSPEIGKMITWSMGLPTHLLKSGINHQLYYFDANAKRAQVAYIERKAAHIEILKRLLHTRNPDFTNKVKWVGLSGLSEKQYAAQIRKSAVFLNLSDAEGYPTSCLEAMAAGAMVVGYDSVGGRALLNGHGANQNCHEVPNGDYINLAYKLEPILSAVLEIRGRMNATILTNAINTVSDITFEREREALIDFWNQFINP